MSPPRRTRDRRESNGNRHRNNNRLPVRVCPPPLLSGGEGMNTDSIYNEDERKRFRKLYDDIDAAILELRKLSAKPGLSRVQQYATTDAHNRLVEALEHLDGLR